MARLTDQEILAIAEAKEVDVVNIKEYTKLDGDLQVRCKAQGHKFITNVKTMRLNSFCCPLCEKQDVVYTCRPPEKKGFRIMGWDQATQNFGISIFDDGRLVYYDVIQFSGETEERLVKIYNFLQYFIEVCEPDFVMFEDIQLQANGASQTMFNTFKVLAELMGIVKMVLTKNKVRHECVLNKIWQAQFAIAGRERMEQKKNVMNKVNQLFGINVTDDVADAILIGKYAYNKHAKQTRPVVPLF